MIYEETYQFLLHNVSSTEFDVILFSLLNSDWDGLIQAPLYQIAEQVGTTEKYLKQIIKKFTSSKRRNIFIPLHTDEGTKYKLNLGPSRNLGFNNKTDRYSKKYSFFYDKSFRNLSINAKRLLLMSAFRMSIFKSETVMFDFYEIIPNTYKEGISLFTRGRLMEAIKEIQLSEVRKYVSISIASNIFTRSQMLIFSYNDGTLNDYISNHTERTILRKRIFQGGFQEYLNDSFCIEIEKVGKYLYNSLLRTEKSNAKKQGAVCDAKDELLKLARFIYNRSIEKLSKSLHTNKHFLTEPKQASAYFSTIIYNESLDEMAKYAHQTESIKSLLDYDYLHKTISCKAMEREVDFIEVHDQIEPIRSKYEQVKYIYNVFSHWCEEWILARVKTVVKDSESIADSTNKEESASIKEKRGWKDLIPAIEYISTLKENVYAQIDNLTTQLTSIGNRAIRREERTKLLKQQKESLSSYFAIQIDKLQNLNELVSE